MASPAAEGSAACAASATWLCGLLSGMADAELLFSRYPWVGFVLVASLGGFVGWCILLERGEYDEEPGLTVFRRLVSRMAIGAAVGVGSYIIWHAFEGATPGMPMMVAALIAVFPLEAYRSGLRRFKNILREAFK